MADRPKLPFQRYKDGTKGQALSRWCISSSATAAIGSIVSASLGRVRATHRLGRDAQ
jgi:hypothetical protein